MKKIAKNIIALVLLILPATTLFASSYQRFYNLAYSNPATLNQVDTLELQTNGILIDSMHEYSGTDGPLSGTATSQTYTFYPYGRIAIRIDPKLVVGVDITHLTFFDIEFPEDAFVRFSATDTILKDVNIAPQFSYQLTDKLALGAGLNFDRVYESEISFDAPPNGELINQSSGWAHGWDVGLSYKLLPKTTVNLSYFSEIVSHPSGISTWGPFTNDAFRFDSVPIPAVFILDVRQKFNDQLSGFVVVRYQLWHIFKSLILENTALGRTELIPTNYNNTWVGLTGLNYKINDKWSTLGGVEYDSNPVSTTYRYIGGPAYSARSAFIGLEHNFTKSFKARILYTYVYTKPPIERDTVRGPVIGDERIVNQIVDLTFTYHI
jgi:long-chain fatty acid transport protein